MEKPCFPPLLPPGFHDLNDSQVEEICVGSFPDSKRRPMLYCNYLQLIDQLKTVNQQHKCFSEVWIDGSFTTEKPEPDDIDILLVLDYPSLVRLPEAMNGLVSTLLNREFVKTNYSIDILLLAENHPDVDYDERRSYWRGWFGFDRKERPKGLMRVML